MKEKKELIKNYLLDEKISEEERKERFEIAWDIWENFDSIRIEKQREIFLKLQKVLLEELQSTPYEITSIDWGAIYIAKKEWKETLPDRGIYSLAIEKCHNPQPMLGIVRNKVFTVPTEEKICKILAQNGYTKTQWWLGYAPISKEWYPNRKRCYLDIFYQPNNVIEKLKEEFKTVYELVINSEELKVLLDKAVIERKKDLGILT